MWPKCGEQELRIVDYPSQEHKENVLSVSSVIEEPFTHYCMPWRNATGSRALKSIGLGCNYELTEENVKSILLNAGLSGEFCLFKSECSYRIR